MPAPRPTGAASQTFCSGATIANLVATGTGIKWYSTSSGGSSLATTTVLVNGTHYYATQTTVTGCESTSRLDVTATVNTTPAVTPNKVDATCTFANGSITPVLSGGLTNVRYIKLTQKYANYQQVAEIEAFEIFTGTNVALSSNGATATASSVYGDNIPVWGPAFIIDGNPTHPVNTNFWHSKLPNINQWIQVDLATAKNIDFIKIYNRADCCQDRGQNMLLELFGPSNNLLYSKTIDLYQGGVSAPVTVDILNLAWADGATTLNRTGLNAGTYTLNYNIDATGCSANFPITITAPTTANWNGTVWSGTASSTSPPTLLQPVVFAGNYTTGGTNINGCSCTINSGATVTVSSGDILTITNNVDVNTAAGTSLTFENNSSLVQTNGTAVNTGNIIYKRNTQDINRYDFTYWSTPVRITATAGQNLSAFQYTSYTNSTTNTLGPALSDKYFEFNPATNQWNNVTAASTAMTLGRGYCVRAPQSFAVATPKTTAYGVFTGIPNNGLITIAGSATAGNYNLLGNPYPSAINADDFIIANSAVLKGTLYFWTHNTGTTYNGTTGTYDYNNNDYSTYTLTGGVAATGGASPASLGKIAAGQGFFVESFASGNVIFNNTMRSSAYANNQFYRTSNKKTVHDKTRLWLNLTNANGIFKQILVGYIDGATNDLDNLYDSETFDGNTYADFYSINTNKNLVIQGRSLPFTETDEIPLGYKSSLVEPMQIAIGSSDGFLNGHPVYLEDKKLNMVHDLAQGMYTFVPIIGAENGRFVLKYSNNSNALSAKSFESISNNVLVYLQDEIITIDALSQNVNNVQVYDILGRLILNLNANQSKVSLNNFVSSKQVVIVKVTLNSGVVKTQKIAF